MSFSCKYLELMPMFFFYWEIVIHFVLVIWRKPSQPVFLFARRIGCIDERRFLDFCFNKLTLATHRS